MITVGDGVWDEYRLSGVRLAGVIGLLREAPKRAVLSGGTIVWL